MSDDDIIVYKTMIFTDKPGHFYSSTRSFPYVLGFHYIEDDFDIDSTLSNGFRSYTTFEAAKYWADFTGIAVIVCEIPAGTPYYENEITEEAFSKELIIREVTSEVGYNESRIVSRFLKDVFDSVPTIK